MTSRRTPGARAALATLALSLAVPLGGPAVHASNGRTTAPLQAAAPIPARLLVPLRISAPHDVAVADDGTVYATEPSTGRVLSQRPDGTVAVLPIEGLDAPSAVAVAGDGTVYVAQGNQIRSLSPDGREAAVEVTGLGEVTGLDVDPEDGSLLVADTATPQVVRVATDGTQQAVDLDGRTSFVGVAAGPAGDVLIIDPAANDVAILHPDGTSELAGLTGLAEPTDLAQRNGTIAVTQPGSVLRLSDGVGSASTAPIEVSGGIAIGPEGDVFASTAPAGTCRCPEAPGAVLRVAAAGTSSEVTFGDVGSIPAITAATPGTVVFTSFQGPLGYSEENPLRQVRGDGPPDDLDVGGAEGPLVAGAPDGTLYLASGPDLVRVPPSGSPVPITLPTEPGMDQVADLAVDGEGRLFVVLGSGYGTGSFLVVEPLAPGGAAIHHRSGANETLHAFAAGGGTLQWAVTRTDRGSQRLVRLPLAGGPAADVALDPNPIADLAVDGRGTSYLIEPGSPTTLRVQPATGPARVLAYDGQREPQRVAVGPDGTLYVADGEVGLLALDDVAAAAGPPTTTTTPPPAVPQPGAPSYTG